MKSLVIGLGQIGQPLPDILSDTYDVIGKDNGPGRDIGRIDCLHICYPYNDEFVGISLDYIREYSAPLCIIHSTVVPGTTDEIQTATVCNVAYSPVRGRHGQMRDDLLKYIKFVGGSMEATAKALNYLRTAGFRVGFLPSAKALELAKLLETTYSGLLVAWAQDVQRFCDKLGVNRLDALKLTDELDHLPRYKFYPGYIGGHCIAPNLDLLEKVRSSTFIDAIRESNEQRFRRAIREDEDLTVRHEPRP